MEQVRICQYYVVGKLGSYLAYDEYDSGSGTYFTEDLNMCLRLNYTEALKLADRYEKDVLLVSQRREGNNPASIESVMEMEQWHEDQLWLDFGRAEMSHGD